MEEEAQEENEEMKEEVQQEIEEEPNLDALSFRILLGAFSKLVLDMWRHYQSGNRVQETTKEIFLYQHRWCPKRKDKKEREKNGEKYPPECKYYDKKYSCKTTNTLHTTIDLQGKKV